MDRIRFRIEHNPDFGYFQVLSRVTGESQEFLLGTFATEDDAVAEIEALEHRERAAWQ